MSEHDTHERDHTQDNEAASEPVANAHFWQNEAGTDRYVLCAQGQTVAEIDVAAHVGELFIEDHDFRDVFDVPQYVCAFGEAEHRLGLPRIDDVRAADGSPDPGARRLVELTAALDREARTPVEWVRAHARHAFSHLNTRATTDGLTHESDEARQELAAVLNEPGETSFQNEDKVRAHLNKAFDLLLVDQEVVDVDNQAMLMHCERAIATLDYEHAQEVMAFAHEEEALRRGMAAPEQVAEDDSDAWLFQPSRAGRDSEREHQDARGIDAEDSGREM